MRYCIVSLIEGEIKDYFDRTTTEVAEKFGVRDLSKRVPCHITMKYPFEAGEEEVLKIEEKIAQIAASRQEVGFETSAFENFDEQTIFLAIDHNQKLVAALKECVEALGVFDEDRRFDINEYHPHISLIRYLTPETFPRVWEYLANQPRPTMCGAFNNISLLVKSDEVWNIHKMFRFL